MPRTIYLRIAYDGTDFHGWQTQPGLRTVQDTLEQTIRRVVRHPLELVGSGRTDAGVHAAGQAAAFVTTCPLDEQRMLYAIRSRLPEDVTVSAVQEVHPDFDATRSALSKLYRYRIHNTDARPVEHLTQRYAFHCWHPLDAARMADAARHFVGEMDFAAVAGSGCRKPSTVRTVLRCEVERRSEEIWIDVEGRGFLYNQVRNMVGTLINVGVGRWEPDRIPAILASRDRSQAGPTVPARGLCLRWVKYPDHLLRPPDKDGSASPYDALSPDGKNESERVEGPGDAALPAHSSPASPGFS